MRGIFRWFLFFISALLPLMLSASVFAQAGPLSFSSSTQFLWGDDLLGENQAIIAQYLRFGLKPEDKKYSIAGYVRIWQALDSGAIRDDEFNARIYYLFLEYAPNEKVSLKLGRQFTAFTSGKTIMDGARVDVHNIIGPVGITVAGGRDVVYSLDSEYSRNGNYFAGIDLHLENVKATQLGISYVRKYDASDLAREELGMNFRYFYKKISPYAEVRYDVLSRTFDEAVLGLDFFPVSNLMIKGEFYQSYPTFDATSIYSVFAVDKFREYLLRAEYSFDKPVTLFASYSRQTYEDDPGADVYTVGTRVSPNDKLTLSASVDYRNGYSGFNGTTGDSDGNLFGFEVSGDYKLRKELLLSAGVQYDSYDRPDSNGEHSAQRYWLGGRWLASKNISVSARFEEDINPNFKHRTLGRVALDWSL